jgi:hypothetical protein
MLALAARFATSRCSGSRPTCASLELDLFGDLLSPHLGSSADTCSTPDTHRNQPEVRKELGASSDRTFESCNMQVNQAFQFQGALACIFLRLRDLCSVP